MILIKKSDINEDTLFNLNGLDYNKGIYTLYYNNKVLTSSGDIDTTKIQIGIRSKSQATDVLITPNLVNSYTKDGTTPYSNFNELILDLSDLLCFKNGGGLGNGIVITEVTTFAEITNGVAGLYYLTVEDNTDPNDVKEIGEYIKLSDESIFSTKPNMAQIDTTKPDYVKNKNRVIQVLVSRNLQPSDNDAWLIVTDNVTLTLTSNLQSDFACNIDTEGVTCDINAGTETLYAPSGNQVVADGSGIIYRKPNGEFTFKTN